MFPLVSELLHHVLVFRIPAGNFQDCWRSAKRDRTAVFRTKIALFTANLNCWHFLAEQTDFRYATFDSRTSMTMGAEFCRSSVCVDKCSFSTSGNDTLIFARWRALPRLTGAPTVVIELFGAPSPTKIVH